MCYSMRSNQSFSQEVLAGVLCTSLATRCAEMLTQRVDVRSGIGCCHPNSGSRMVMIQQRVPESSWGQREQETGAAQTRDGGSERSRLTVDVNQGTDSVAMVTKQIPESFQALRV